MWKVLAISLFTNTFPKSISTGPAYIFFNSSPVNSIATSLFSLWVYASYGNALRIGYNGSG